MSHVSWLSDQFCIYKLKLRFLKRGSRITDATPSPLCTGDQKFSDMKTKNKIIKFFFIDAYPKCPFAFTVSCT